MAELESMFWQKKAIERNIVLKFDEGDDVLKCLEQVMHEHKILKANVVEFTGHIKNGAGNYIQGSQFMTKNFDNTGIKKATGYFTINPKVGLFGVLKIIPADLDNHVTIAKAFAMPDLELKLQYYDYE